MLTPKENYLAVLRGEIPEYMPSFYEPYSVAFDDELLTPCRAPDGPIVTGLGVTYVGSEEINSGAMPKPGEIMLEDITKWRDVIKLPDLTGRDWERYYKKVTEAFDPNQVSIHTSGGDYFLTLVSLMGFENAMIAMYEEPEEVIAMLDYISGFYTEVLKQQIKYANLSCYTLMDDDAAYTMPFFSVDTYRKIFKPFHKKHCDILRNAGIPIVRHDCGKSEQFIEDWLELGIVGWNPCQTTNDLKAVKKKYGNRLTLSGCWDNQGELGNYKVDEKRLKDALVEYVDTFAPGGRFCFMASVNGPFGNAEADAKREIIKEFFFDYARDWYKTH